MNKRQILASLNKIANELDYTGLHKEANSITNIMKKLAADFDPNYDLGVDGPELSDKFDREISNTPSYIGNEQRLYNPKEFDLIIKADDYRNNTISVGPIPVSEFYKGSTFNRYSLGNSLQKVFHGEIYDPQDYGSHAAQSLDIDVDNKIVTFNVKYEVHPVLKEIQPALQQLVEEFNDKVRKNRQKNKSEIQPNRKVNRERTNEKVYPEISFRDIYPISFRDIYPERPW